MEIAEWWDIPEVVARVKKKYYLVEVKAGWDLLAAKLHKRAGLSQSEADDLATELYNAGWRRVKLES